ncbi:MAG: transposase [Desulfobacterales bacterium]
MELASIVEQYYDRFMEKHGQAALPGHLSALHAIHRCRTPASGEFYVQCPGCQHAQWKPLSCGNRSCPKCQNHEAGQWIDRQKEKLLPVLYFMTTFTLPYELRSFAWRHQRKVYSLFFSCVADTLKDFGANPRHMGAEIGMTMVLHTHSRKLDFHPHIHVVVPGGGVVKLRRQWKKKKGKYLFNEFALATVFRARFLAALKKAGLYIPPNIPAEWVVDCKRVGQGIAAIKYLSRYLYRGVISEKNIVANQNGRITFKYTESKTGRTRYRTLDGEDFLQLILQHVLPKGFRRVRDHGFLHGNAKKTLLLVQLILHVRLGAETQRPRPAVLCPCCRTPMIIMGFRYAAWKPG